MNRTARWLAMTNTGGKATGPVHSVTCDTFSESAPGSHNLRIYLDKRHIIDVFKNEQSLWEAVIIRKWRGQGVRVLFQLWLSPFQLDVRVVYDVKQEDGATYATYHWPERKIDGQKCQRPDARPSESTAGGRKRRQGAGTLAP